MRALRRLREQRGLTQVQLARAIHRSDAFISQLEAGVKRPSAETLIRLAAALHTSVDALLTEEPPEPPQTRAASQG
jgi:transcriptional regulator with XRE-family HTH domain